MGKKILFFLFVQLILHLARAASNQDQSGSEVVDLSTESSQSILVSFSGFGFTQTPSVFVWVETGITGPHGNYRAVVESTDVNGFSAKVSRYDTEAGWDSPLTLRWEAKVYDNGYRTSVGSWDAEAGGKIKTVRVNFLIPYTTVPFVEAWTRGLARYPDIFETSVSNVGVSGFDAIIKRSDSGRSSDSWSQSPTLYWTEKDTINQKASVSTVGDDQLVRMVNIPSAIWVYTPVLAQTSENSYDVLGREVHLSSVLNMLTNETMSFPVTQTSERRMKIELSVRGDTIYVDQNNLKFQGLKKLSIYSRKLVANNNTVILQAPVVCERLDGESCTYLTKASSLNKGANGKDGADTPTTNIYVHEIDGSINFSFKGSEGNKGEDGGNGVQGQDNTYESPELSHGETCKNDCGALFDEKKYTGRPGPNGGNGIDGMKGGDAGHGGDISKISVNIEKVSGLLNVEQNPGKGGIPGDHGYGGRQGYGGTGGCGRICHNWLMCVLVICWPECTSDEGACYERGPDGIDGTAGFDGYAVYPVPAAGLDGKTTRANLNVVSSLKDDFNNQDDLINLMKRHGESMFQRNDNKEAEDIFNFILSISEENTTIYNEVSESLRMIQSGFDYYGNDEIYAPDLDWSYLSIRTDNLLQAGKSFESAYNSVKENIDDIFQTTATIQSVATVAISAEDSELANKESELKNEKNLYYKSLRQLERTMKGEVLQINILVPLAVVQEKVKDLASGIPSLVGGIAGFVGGLVHGDWSSAFASATQALNVIFGRDSCDAPSIKEAAKMLQEKLEFGYEYERIQPEDLDFSTFDVSMVPEIMLSDLAKNKATLIKELECLYDMKNSEIIDKLDRVLDNFFRDAALRISLMDKLMNIDIQLKEIGYNRDLLQETQETLDTVSQSAEESLSMGVKMSYADLLFNLYQQEENTIMRSIYELSKSYQFSCLWNFHALDKYNNYFSDEVMTSNLGTLQGVTQLEFIRQSLEDERNVFLNIMASSAGPSSHVYTLFNQFNQETSPDIISDLQSSGTFIVRINLDADDLQTTGCDNCYNQRLESLYIELEGSDQPSTVPTKLYLKVSHLGDSYFLVPTTSGGKEVVLLQQSPESGGHIMSFDSDNLVSSTADPQLAGKFLKQEHKFCDNSNDFFGEKPCKSPYSTFVITIPKNTDYVCTLNPSEMISGTNCQDLDLTLFTSVKVYAKINSWSDYPPRPESSTLSRLITEMRQQD